MHLKAAPVDADPFDPDVIRSVNPAIGGFLDESDVLAEAERARRLPSFESAFRNLRLNQRIAPFGRDLLMKPEAWAVGDGPSMRPSSQMVAQYSAASTCRRVSTSRRWCWRRGR